MGKEYLSRWELENLGYGDVLKYNTELGGISYLIVEEVREGRVCGDIAIPIGINSISIEELVKKKPLLGKFD